ncbi:hypothetical protein F5Y03DRAFT_382905 [Xylaria venustula]|nr:hypothetical protein F5Y03DRAFT_382905 [Xylaria venustula]
MASKVTMTRQNCANVVVCKKLGNLVCAGCHLVTYCSSDCQKMNWSVHKTTCLEKSTTATFETEHRLPIWAPRTLYTDLLKKCRRVKPQVLPRIGPPNRREFVGGDYESGQFELFGSYPAIDVLRLEANEGTEWKDSINVLFVQPTDLRDVIKTIVDLPDKTSASINVTITDETTTKTARNLILLLLALSSDDPDVTAECAVPFWYSPFIPKWCLSAIRELTDPFIDEDDQGHQETDGEHEGLITKHWSFGQALLEAKQGECANLDDYERTVMDFPPEWQAAKRRYMPSTQVTPFENHHSADNWPLDYNPSLFYGNFWPLRRDADPLRGWDLATINENNGTDGADNDIYGKMFYYVRDMFKRFILKLRTVNVTFRVLPYSGIDLTEETKLEFDRIETAALADEDLVGVRTVVNTLSPLLKPPSTNPHATMITLHPAIFDKIQDAFPCRECDPKRAERVKKAVDLTATERSLLDAYLPLQDPDPINWLFTATGWKRRDARWLFRDPSAAWELYKDIYDFEDVADSAKVVMKTTHKVVEEWILRLKHANSLDEHGRPAPEARWDFNAVLATRQTAGYRYVEWRKLTAEEGVKLEGKFKSAKRNKQEPKRHEVYHEYLSNADLAKLEKKGSRLERWMGKENCANWTPY